MQESLKKNVYNIDAGRPFARLIAEKLLHDFQDNLQGLTDVTVLLPTRRACRNFQNTFLQITEGKPLLLPKIQPLGDVDEQDLSLSLANTDMLNKILDLPPAISPLRRRILLAKTISALEGFTSSFDKAIALADALAQFMDQIIIEGLEFSALENIVPQEFADHWQITLNFLKILGEYWPTILKEEKAIDAADRRNRLMGILSDYWEETKPITPIIAAGSTGSIPATGKLLSVVASLPAGKVILPGLDRYIDDKSWKTLDESHPQYGLKKLITNMGLDRSDIENWHNSEKEENPRLVLASEIMRPSETTQNWQNTYKNQTEKLHQAINNIEMLELETRREEATAIALKFRETLEEKTKTAALITPDRKLARQVSAICKRWGINVDDSSGISLSYSPVGVFSLLLCDSALQSIKPKSFLALLKNKYTHFGIEKSIYTQAISDLEKYALRGISPKAGFDGLKNRIEQLEHAPDMTHVLDFLSIIEPQMKPLIEIMNDTNMRFFKEFLSVHIKIMENLATTISQAGEDILWVNEDGEALAQLFSELWEHADAFEPVDGHSYMRILSHLMASITIRPKYGTHPRLSILGQLEARLVETDLLILSGLNEGSWPPDPGHDPWMSRPMRKEFGMPSPERSVGLAAHDFVQGFCNQNMILTRSKTVDGTQQVPARWLQRLDTVLKTNDMSLNTIIDHKTLAYIKALDHADSIKPYGRPAPKPPIDKRPRNLSVTKIETWQKDPYSIYASEILRLRKLDALQKPIEAKEKGIILHSILERFTAQYKGTVPSSAKSILFDIAEQELENFDDNKSNWSFWWPRFEKITEWFIDNETHWIKNNRNMALEAKGEVEIKTENAFFIIKGVADRIDLNHEGDCAIIDYKTSRGFSATKMANGENPQLPLEALMLTKNGFADNGIIDKNASYLGYWCMTGGTQSARIIELPNKKNPNISEIVKRTEDGLKRLIDCFADPKTSYICLPKSDQLPRFNDYEHLARVKEWAALDDQEQEAM